MIEVVGFGCTAIVLAYFWPRDLAQLAISAFVAAAAVFSFSRYLAFGFVLVALASWFFDSHHRREALLTTREITRSASVVLVLAVVLSRSEFDQRVLISLGGLLAFGGLAGYVYRTQLLDGVVRGAYRAGSLVVAVNALATLLGFESSSTNRFFEASSSFGGTRLAPLLTSAPDELSSVAAVTLLFAIPQLIQAKNLTHRIPHLLVLAQASFLLYRLNYRAHVLLLLVAIGLMLLRRSRPLQARTSRAFVLSVSILPLLWLPVVDAVGPAIGKIGTAIPGIERDGATTVDEIYRLNGRLDIWESTFRSMNSASLSDLVFGVGTGNQSEYGGGIIDGGLSELENFRDIDSISAHSSFLQTTIEFGLVGLALWLTLLYRSTPPDWVQATDITVVHVCRVGILMLAMTGALSTTLTPETSESMLLLVLLSIGGITARRSKSEVVDLRTISSQPNDSTAERRGLEESKT